MDIPTATCQSLKSKKCVIWVFNIHIQTYIPIKYYIYNQMMIKQTFK